MVDVGGKTKRPGGGKPSKSVPTANLVCETLGSTLESPSPLNIALSDIVSDNRPIYFFIVGPASGIQQMSRRRAYEA